MSSTRRMRSTAHTARRCSASVRFSTSTSTTGRRPSASPSASTPSAALATPSPSSVDSAASAASTSRASACSRHATSRSTAAAAAALPSTRQKLSRSEHRPPCTRHVPGPGAIGGGAPPPPKHAHASSRPRGATGDGASGGTTVSLPDCIDRSSTKSGASPSSRATSTYSAPKIPTAHVTLYSALTAPSVKGATWRLPRMAPRRSSASRDASARNAPSSCSCRVSSQSRSGRSPSRPAAAACSSVTATPSDAALTRLPRWPPRASASSAPMCGDTLRSSLRDSTRISRCAASTNWTRLMVAPELRTPETTSATVAGDPVSPTSTLRSLHSMAGPVLLMRWSRLCTTPSDTSVSPLSSSTAMDPAAPDATRLARIAADTSLSLMGRCPAPTERRSLTSGGRMPASSRILALDSLDDISLSALSVASLAGRLPVLMMLTSSAPTCSATTTLMSLASASSPRYSAMAT
nr:unnamed protein product [Digitaria exilis]